MNVFHTIRLKNDKKSFLEKNQVRPVLRSPIELRYSMYDISFLSCCSDLLDESLMGQKFVIFSISTLCLNTRFPVFSVFQSGGKMHYE